MKKLMNLMGTKLLSKEAQKDIQGSGSSWYHYCPSGEDGECPQVGRDPYCCHNGICIQCA